MKSKVCIKCKKEKPVDKFNKKRDSKDGLYSYCRSCDNDRSLKYYRNNLEKSNENSKKWRKLNPVRRRIYQKEWDKKILKTPRGNLDRRMRSLIYCSLKINLNSPTLHKLVDYTPHELKIYFESLFTDGMTWSNYGEWEIDHIRPVYSFDYDSPDDPEFQECWALSNLQPLWHEDNVRKGQSIPENN